MLYPSRLKQSGGGTGGTEVYIDGVKSSAERVDLNSLIKLPNLSGNPQIIIYDDKIHILGIGSSNINHYKYDDGWIEVSELPYGFSSGVALVYNNEIHILGAYASENRTKHYKWNGTSWVSVSTLPYQFYYGSAVVYNDEIHILGSVESSSQTKHYKWNGSSWSSVSTLPYSGYYASAVVYNDEIHILGGNSSLYTTAEA